MRKSKSFKLEALLERRIMMGDYALLRFPSERKLAASEGVTQPTARKAIMSLTRRGLLARLPNGSVCPAASNRGEGAVFALLAPAYPTWNVLSWEKALASEGRKIGWSLKTVVYRHWDDPIIEESFSGFSGAFLFPVSEAVDGRVRLMLESAKIPLACLGQDMSSLGIPSIFIRPEHTVFKVLDHLEKLGHRRIDCLNAQPNDSINLAKIGAWRKWLVSHGLEGELLDFPVESYGHVHERARERVWALLDAGSFASSCLLCTTESAAIGASRALISRGIFPGKGISLCAPSDEGMASFVYPSITSVRTPDCSKELRLCLEWMRKGRGSWEGPLALSLEGEELFIGESSAKASVKRVKH